MKGDHGCLAWWCPGSLNSHLSQWIQKNGIYLREGGDELFKGKDSTELSQEDKGMQDRFSS